jgi:hypothetical protein
MTRESRDDERKMRTFSLLLAFTVASVCLGAGPNPASTSQSKEPSYSGKALAQWTVAAQAEDVGSRRQAAAALGELGTAAIPALVKLLKDQNAGVRVNAASALGDMSPEATTAIAALKEVLDDKDVSARYSAAYALGKIGLEALPVLTELLKDGDPIVRNVAAGYLERFYPSNMHVRCGSHETAKIR